MLKNLQLTILLLLTTCNVFGAENKTKIKQTIKYKTENLHNSIWQSYTKEDYKKGQLTQQTVSRTKYIHALYPNIYIWEYEGIVNGQMIDPTKAKTLFLVLEYEFKKKENYTLTDNKVERDQLTTTYRNTKTKID